MEADTAIQILPPCHPAAPCAAPSMSQHKHWVSCMRKIRGIIPVINSLFICQFNVNLGQFPVGLGQEQDEATGDGRAAWLSYSELKCSQYYSLSLESRMTQKNVSNWFLDLCISVALCTHYPKKKPPEKNSKQWINLCFPTRPWKVSGGRGISCRPEFIQGSDLPYIKWFSDHNAAWGGQGHEPPKSILRLKSASLGLYIRIDKTS